MFSNIGSKIMSLAKFLCWIGIILTFSIGVVLIIIGFDIYSPVFVVVGIGASVVGPIISWLSSFVLCGFGRLVENSDIIAGRR